MNMIANIFEKNRRNNFEKYDFAYLVKNIIIALFFEFEKKQKKIT